VFDCTCNTQNVCVKDPETYADSGVDIGRVYHAGQVKGDDPD